MDASSPLPLIGEEGETGVKKRHIRGLSSTRDVREGGEILPCLCQFISSPPPDIFSLKKINVLIFDGVMITFLIILSRAHQHQI